MNMLDFIIACVMVFLIVRGIFRGIIKEVVSLVGVVVAIWVANKYQPALTIHLREIMPPFPLLPLFSFAILFVAVMLGANVLGRILRGLLQKGALGWLDRLLGAGFATVKGLIITYLAIVLLTFFLPSRTPLVATSRLAPLIISSYQHMVKVISPEFCKKWKEGLLRQKEKAQKGGDLRSPRKKQQNGR
ncbi:MAG: CvpA family protein [Deltaproteobacteria bacterium]|nr:CvpA family protein [Deltaproteobacteria bacterium]MBW2024411.1 CvpA family protein [Deltaproteobacteria bacterium]